MKRLAISSAILLASLGCVSSAYAANWVQVLSGSNGTASYDTSSVVVSGHLVRVWLDYKWPAPAVIDPHSPAPAETKTRLIINCRNHTVASGPGIRYDAAGEVLDSQQGLPAIFRTPAPDSASEKVASLVCQAKQN
jgi:hypothetical protein